MILLFDIPHDRGIFGKVISGLVSCWNLDALGSKLETKIDKLGWRCVDAVSSQKGVVARWGEGILPLKAMAGLTFIEKFVSKYRHRPFHHPTLA